MKKVQWLVKNIVFYLDIFINYTKILPVTVMKWGELVTIVPDAVDATSESTNGCCPELTTTWAVTWDFESGEPFDKSALVSNGSWTKS